MATLTITQSTAPSPPGPRPTPSAPGVRRQQALRPSASTSQRAGGRTHSRFSNTEQRCSHPARCNATAEEARDPRESAAGATPTEAREVTGSVSHPHTPSLLLPLSSKFSVLSVASVSPIPVAGFLSSSEGPEAVPPVGPAGLDCMGALSSAESPCSCHRERGR